MGPAQETCWTLIRRAAAEDDAAREEFSRHYLGPIRAYFAGRWHGAPLVDEIDDAVQAVFVECFKEGGVVDRADSLPGRSFRSFLFGVVRNVAMRHEKRRAREGERHRPQSFHASRHEDEEARLSGIFDRAWAHALVREATRRHEERARERGEEARRRVDLLRLRFEQELPIREIARRWQVPAETLHREYAKARREFKDTLFEVAAYHHGGARTEVEREYGLIASLLG